MDALRVLCEKHHVKALYLFGSATRDDFDPATSDLDFLVEFQPLDPIDHANHWFGLIEDIEALFERKVDVVESPAITNPYFRKIVDQTRVPLYDAA